MHNALLNKSEVQPMPLWCNKVIFFEIHTDASKTQLESVISQHGKPIAFYSRKLNPAQTEILLLRENS